VKIAIIGHGFVGNAVDYGFPSTQCEKYIIDPKHNTHIKDLKGVNIDYAFVCVPTPMAPNGDIDATIITQVVTELSNTIEGVIIVKSTVTPDILVSFLNNPDNHNLYDRFVYNPEFLTEKSANEDFVNPFIHVFGGVPEVTSKVEELYKYYSICKPCPVFHMSHIDASFVKYGVNSYLASKVLWFNQFYDLVTTCDSNFGKIIGAITADSRVGRSHTTVPGFDGKRGFGGACFPKDTNAFVKFADSVNIDMTVLKEVIRSNNNYRANYEKDSREKEQKIFFSNTV